jgi:hypothetical protein
MQRITDMKRYLIILFALLIVPTLLAACSPGSKVYTGSPQDLLCLVEDLPGGAADFVPRENGISQQSNDTLKSLALDVPGTNDYLLQTGRVDGWMSDFLSSNREDTSRADEVFCQVVTFQTKAGASTALNWDLPNEGVKFTPLNVDEKIGQDMRVDKGQYVDQKGKTYDIYHVQFQHQNLLGNIQVFFAAGTDQQKALDFTLDVAKNLLERFHAAPMSTPEPTQN